MTAAGTNPSPLRSALPVSPRHQRRGPCQARRARRPPRSQTSPAQPVLPPAPPGHACRSRGQPLSPPCASVSPAAARPSQAAGAPLGLGFPRGHGGDGVGGPGVRPPACRTSQTPPGQGVPTLGLERVPSAGMAVNLRPAELITPVCGNRCQRSRHTRATGCGTHRAQPQ